MPLIDIKELKGCCIIRPHGSEEIALTQQFSERLNHFEIPTVDAEPVRHGRWDDSADGITPYCTVCGRTHCCFNRTPNFCPNCGAKMDAAADQGGGADNAAKRDHRQT